MKPVRRVLFNVEHRRGHPLMLRNFVQLKVGQATVQPKAQGNAVESGEIVVRGLDIAIAIGWSSLRDDWHGIR